MGDNHVYTATELDRYEGPFTERRSKWARSVSKRLRRLEQLVWPRVGRMRERVVEYPLALRALGRLGAGSRVADIGGASALLGVELAAYGFEVEVLDLRPAPMHHPRVRVREVDVLEAELEDGRYDGIACISVIEHVGVARYGGQERPEGDMEMMAQLRRLCREGGVLALSGPYGVGHDPRQGPPGGYRVYDRERLGRLVAGWEVESLRFFRMVDGAWVEVSQGEADGVATARPVDGVFFAELRRPGQVGQA